MKEQIEKRLQALIGLPLVKAGRAEDLAWFDFGKQRPVIDRRGTPKTIGDYTLHVQCGWRLIGPEGRMVAARDRSSDGHSAEGRSEAGSGSPETIDVDERIRRFIEEKREVPPVVERIEADAFGALRVDLHGGYRLELFPDDSGSKEFWRLFKPSDAQSHFVVTSTGIEALE